MKILVTGATGFLGQRTVQKLLSEGYDVLGTGRNKTIGARIEQMGANFEAGDLTHAPFVDHLVQQVDYIIHSAALSSPWGRYQEFVQANIVPTANLVQASLKHEIKRLVHISTPSIYFEYKDKFNIEENEIPSSFVNHYASTKYEAEKLVKKAFDSGLETISLRPRAIIGGGDTTIVPRMIRAHREGKLKIIGHGRNIVDVTSVSNVVDAIILSLKASENALGKAYNITNGDPIYLWKFIEKTFEQLNLTLNKTRVPFPVAYAAAALLEKQAALKPDYPEPPVTCYGIGILAKSMTMSIDRAKELLGYWPNQSNLEALDEFIDWWKSQESQQKQFFDIRNQSALDLSLLTGGYCTHKEHMVMQGAPAKERKFPSMFAVIKHPDRGVILFDTGYSQHFHNETSYFPNKIYAKVTPVHLKAEETAMAQLKQQGITPEQVTYIIISHFHGDHIAGLRDFPNATFLALESGYNKIKKLKGIPAVRIGYLPQLLPDNFAQRVQFIEKEIKPITPFKKTLDIFGDQSLLAIPLEGHFAGQIGLLMTDKQVGKTFLIADACWLSEAYQKNILPHPLAMLIMNNRKQYKDDLRCIHQFSQDNPDIKIIPSHCSETIEAYQKEKQNVLER